MSDQDEDATPAGFDWDGPRWRRDVDPDGSPTRRFRNDNAPLQRGAIDADASIGHDREDEQPVQPSEAAPEPPA